MLRNSVERRRFVAIAFQQHYKYDATTHRWLAGDIIYQIIMTRQTLHVPLELSHIDWNSKLRSQELDI